MSRRTFTKKDEQAAPRCYLSRRATDSQPTGIAWSLILDGMPLCKEYPSRREPEKCAATFRVTPAAIWDGDAGRFIPLTDGAPK